MPAHLRTLWLRCSHEGCHRSATVELFNGQNASFGKFCQPHGQARLKALQKAEREALKADLVSPEVEVAGGIADEVEA